MSNFTAARQSLICLYEQMLMAKLSSFHEQQLMVIFQVFKTSLNWLRFTPAQLSCCQIIVVKYNGDQHKDNRELITQNVIRYTADSYEIQILSQNISLKYSYTSTTFKYICLVTFVSLHQLLLKDEVNTDA